MNLILWRHADAEGGSPDSGRRLTKLGRAQADRVSAWLKPRLPAGSTVLVSPVVRAQQTAAALGRPFVTTPAIGVDASASDLVNAAGWPSGEGTVVIVGHQPTLGRVAAMLLSGSASDWEVAKGALWWFVRSNGKTALRAAVDPGLLGAEPGRE